MSISLRRSAERETYNHGWLQTAHSFSFADYYDPQWMGLRSLRVINEDLVAPGKGFGTHPHRDMEILTYVLKGSLAHKDSMGNVVPIPSGDVQYLSAGSGVEHSEFNHSKTDPVHLLQIWITPSRRGEQPRYAQHLFPREEKLNKICLLASGHVPAPIEVRQDASMYAGILQSTQRVSFLPEQGRAQWIQFLRGMLVVNGISASTGDAFLMSEEKELVITAPENEAEFLLFDLG